MPISAPQHQYQSDDIARSRTNHHWNSGPRNVRDYEQTNSTMSGSSINHETPLRRAVVSGELGGGYGPYAYGNGSPASSSGSSPSQNQSPSRTITHSRSDSIAAHPLIGNKVLASWTMRDAALDAKLHNGPVNDFKSSRSCSSRGWVNMTVLVILVGGLIALFTGYPIITSLSSRTIAASSKLGAYNVGGINASGQIPAIAGLPTLIDKDTPVSAYSHTGTDGAPYVLAFSDEFNVDGRTFWPGDDPYWEAVDLQYWATDDYEWYDPGAVTTKAGKLVITMTEEPIHGESFSSGMLQSWNAFCFTGGYIEVSVSLPGTSDVAGFWPGVWTLGNLARAGYGATTDGLWPYSYNTCDVGTLPNQLKPDGSGPVASLSDADGGQLSSLTGQRLSACTCKGEDHPGPATSTGRGAPEIDVLEAQINYAEGVGYTGAVSQSAQVAPFNADYQFNNATPYTTIRNADNTYLNTYLGGPYQQAVSGVTITDQTAYQGSGGKFATYGYENYPDPVKGHVAWYANNKVSWTITPSSIGADSATKIGPRLLSQEPMSIILNLGLSASFQTINWKSLVFPGVMLVDYVRVYQRTDSPNLGCSPPGFPTASYIANHAEAYHNPNATTWEQAGYVFPKNSLSQSC